MTTVVEGVGLYVYVMLVGFAVMFYLTKLQFSGYESNSWVADVKYSSSITPWCFRQFPELVNFHLLTLRYARNRLPTENRQCLLYFSYFF